ncbi:MAG: hypothetical protein ACOYN9_16565 [Saprospiraceae bacterium]
MNVHIIRDEHCPLAVYQNVFEKLSKSAGVIRFIKSKDDTLITDDTDDMFNEREREPINKYHFLSFSQLYDICENYRKKHSIDKNDHVFLLSGANNYQNWFSNMDHEGNNYFVQVTEWELFFGAETEVSFLLCYQVMAWLLKRNMFSSEKEVMDAVHHKPIGCMMDFCEEKKDITLKIRTADLCPKCLNIIKSKDVPLNFLNQVFSLWEEIRKNIAFRERAEFLNKMGRMIINPSKKILFFPDYGDIVVKLPPKEMTFYQLFISEPNGINMNSLRDHAKTLKHYYFIITGNDDIAATENIYSIHDNVPSQLLSRINRILVANLGKTLASYYTLEKTMNEPHKIRINREYVTLLP